MAERYKMYDVAVKVISQKGHCGAGHKVGDEWVMGQNTPAGICLSALYSIFPNAKVLRFGGGFPWRDDPATTTVACPDANNPVVFELRRLQK